MVNGGSRVLISHKDHKVKQGLQFKLQPVAYLFLIFKFYESNGDVEMGADKAMHLGLPTDPSCIHLFLVTCCSSTSERNYGP